jgi:hypothetical protein
MGGLSNMVLTINIKYFGESPRLRVSPRHGGAERFIQNFL